MADYLAGDTGGDWWSQNAPGGVTYDSINALYQKYLGRSASQDEAQNWTSGAYGARDLPGIEQQIAQSGEAQAHGSTSGGAPGGGDPRDPTYAAKLVNYYANQPGANPSLKNDPGYWIGKLTSGELGTDQGYIVGRFMQPEGAPAVSPAGAAYGAYGVPDQPYQSQPFTGDYQTPAIPGYLQQPYQAPQWTGGDFQAPAMPADLQGEFQMPTAAELEASPGYAARLAAQQQALERSAAAHGTILSGGTQADTARLGQDYASNEYNNFFGQKLATRQENFGEYSTNFTNALNQYQMRYGQFLSQAGLNLGARQQNESEFLSNVVNPAQTAFQNRYAVYLGENARTLNDYLTNYNINRTGVQDFLNQNNTVANRGLAAVTAGRPA